MAALAAIGDGVELGLDAGGMLAQRGLVGDVAQRATDRAGTEQRALRAAQGLNPVQVVKVEIRRKQGERNHALVKIDADLLLHARLVAHDLTRRYATDRDLALARPEILDREAGDIARNVLEAIRTGALNIRLGLGIQGEGNVLDRLFAFGRGHDDDFRVIALRKSRHRQ